MGSCGMQKPLRERIRHFTPAWHAVNMGTGAISILFHNFPYGGDTQGMQYAALAILILNVILFIVLTGVAIARYSMFRNIWSTMLHHPVQSLYLGCFPMGFATIIMGSVGILYEHFELGGTAFLYALWALWWVDVAVALSVCFGQLHVMITRQEHQMSNMTTVWLLPIVTLIVASSAGAVIAQSLADISTSRTLLTLAVSLTLVVVGVTLAVMVFTIYLQRLIVHGLPTGISIFSAFLPLGPLGQSGFSILVMGQLSQTLFPLHSGTDTLFTDPITAKILHVLSWCIAYSLWSLATSWILLAVMALGDTLLRGTLPFKITFWGMIFPNGVYANLTIQLAQTMDSRPMRIWGAVYACFTLLLWLFAIARTVPSMWNGSIFEAPCLEDQMQNTLIRAEARSCPEAKAC